MVRILYNTVEGAGLSIQYSNSLLLDNDTTVDICSVVLCYMFKTKLIILDNLIYVIFT